MRLMGNSPINCGVARDWLFRLLDDELDSARREQLESHLCICASCTREWRILSLPRRIGRAVKALEPPPHFYARLRARLDREEQTITMWQLVSGLSRQILPVLATVTLVIVSVFAWLEFRGPGPDLYQAYDSIFLSPDRTSRMVIADEITEESVLHALAEKPSIHVISAPAK
jgi:hypothetical protein